MSWFRKDIYHPTAKMAIVMRRKSGHHDYLIKLKDVPEYQNAYITKAEVEQEMPDDFE